jgi:DNA ligase-associated metallophosphoesterase
VNTYLLHTILNNHFLLSAHRTAFWEEQKALILSDLHIGKTGHFRKNGIGIPQKMVKEDMQRLLAAIQLYKPTQLIIVGDLFHSHSNKEHDLFLKWRNELPNLTIHLVMGNHDILKKEWYQEAGITIHEDALVITPFVFIHDSSFMQITEKNYYFSGHIHPGIFLKGWGKQSLRLPCFYFNKKYAVLPAFGKFTGTFTLEVQKEDAVFALTENSIIQIQ